MQRNIPPKKMPTILTSFNIKSMCVFAEFCSCFGVYGFEADSWVGGVQSLHMATARNIRLGSHTQTHTRSIPRSMGYGSKGGCVIQALGSHNHHHHYYNHLSCQHSFCYCHCTCHLLLLLQQLYCCCHCYSLLSPVLPPPQL